jgi:hypothetical protein
MKDRYLEVTFRKGKVLAAYLSLPRATGEKSARTEQAAPGILVDYSAAGKPIGLELTTPASVSVEMVNGVLDKLGIARVDPKELAPLKAA